MNKIVALLLIFLIAGCGKNDESPTADSPAVAAAKEADRIRNESEEKERAQHEAGLIAAVNKEIQSIHTPKFSIKLNEASWRKITGTIVYSGQPGSFEQARRDTTDLVRTILKTAIASGQNPSKNWMFISVSAFGVVRGESGQQHLISYGSSNYNFNSDSIEYHDPRD